MKFNDITGTYSIKAMRLVEDKTKTNKVKRQELKMLLLEYAKEKNDSKSDYIKKLEEEVGKYREIKRLLK
jgi:hypothetical protein